MREVTLPLARRERLIVQELPPKEIIVYDLERHKAHCLNRSASLVWRYCDGETAPAQMMAKLRHDMGMEIDEEIIWLALERLSKAHLLQNRVARSADGAVLSRR